MAEASERINTPISTAELERRWAAVRAAMVEQRIDVTSRDRSHDRARCAQLLSIGIAKRDRATHCTQ